MKQLLVIDTGFDHKQPPDAILSMSQAMKNTAPNCKNIERKQTTKQQQQDIDINYHAP